MLREKKQHRFTPKVGTLQIVDKSADRSSSALSLVQLNTVDRGSVSNSGWRWLRSRAHESP